MVCMYIEKQMTFFYFVHDEDFETRPNEPKWLIGILCFGKSEQKQEKRPNFRQLMKLLTAL